MLVLTLSVVIGEGKFPKYLTQEHTACGCEVRFFFKPIFKCDEIIEVVVGRKEISGETVKSPRFCG